MNTEPTLENSLHVVNHSSSALWECGCRNQLILRDRLIPGPCDVEPLRHARKRKQYLLANNAECPDSPYDYWNWVTESILDHRALENRLNEHVERHIVLWTSSNFADRLVFWWILDALRRNSFTLNRVWIAEPKLLRGSRGLCYDMSLGSYAPDELKDAFKARRPLSIRMIRTGSSLWQKFAGSSPREFDRACGRSAMSFPNLRRETLIYLSFFPQARDSHGLQLRLSEFDEILLSTLDAKRWRRPIDQFGKDLRLLDFMSLGQFVVAKRLWQLATWSTKEPIIETKSEAHDDELRCFSCRLTPRGKRMLVHGIESPLDGPPIQIGGCCAYGRNPTWVRRRKGRRSSIEILR